MRANLVFSHECNREESWNESVDLHVKLLVCASDRFHLTCSVVVNLSHALAWDWGTFGIWQHAPGQKLVIVAREYKAVEINEAPLHYGAEYLPSCIYLDFVLVSPEMLVL